MHVSGLQHLVFEADSRADSSEPDTSSESGGPIISAPVIVRSDSPDSRSSARHSSNASRTSGT